MLITSREKSLIESIIKTSGMLTPVNLASQLGVSVRTIQRDLKSAEKILKSFDLLLTRNSEEGLIIEGKNEQIFRLVQNLRASQPVDQPPQEKKLNLLRLLLQQFDTYKLQAAAAELGISITTLSAYLDEMEGFMKGHNLLLTRKRGVGIELHGSETDKRKALAAYYLSHFHEELIEALFSLEQGDCRKEKILYYFVPDFLKEIDRQVSTKINSGPSRLADSDYTGLIIHTCISMQRTMSGYPIVERSGTTEDLLNEFSLIEKICRELEAGFPITFADGDLIYLSAVLKGSKLQEAGAVLFDSIILSQKIKNVIKEVSEQLHVDLTKDFSLFQGLLAHMEPALYRMKQNLGIFNPLTEEIRQKYPVLFMAVKKSVEHQFPELEAVSEDEAAFIVLHFGSSLVMREEDVSIHALIVCPTGIGTSKMLASRVKKEIQEIQTIDITTIREISRPENLSGYDLIISTVRLPFMGLDYILVNSLLKEEDIAAIRGYLQRNVEKLTRGKHYEQNTLKRVPGNLPASRGIREILQDIKAVHKSVDDILTNFRFYRVREERSHEEIMGNMLDGAWKEGLVGDVPGVMDALREREQKGGLGVPETGMGLFHCRHSSIKSLIFQVSHLTSPAEIKGMDGNSMKMRNLLLMLAPTELSEREKEIISLISTSLIESSEAILIFSSSSEESIRIRLEEIFLNYINHNLIKE
ncbi:BglG family transcription antiterminator [Peribacillus sp. SCS-37]|uniref:BglG family transcription antiterminator n=1 Tax=Paraperibacillus esterisolvens TaxID=3115296 RepID=UPI0039068008